MFKGRIAKKDKVWTVSDSVPTPVDTTSGLRISNLLVLVDGSSIVFT